MLQHAACIAGEGRHVSEKDVASLRNLVIDFRQLILGFVYDEKYDRFNKRFNYLDDGRASERVVERVIK